jgi:N-acetylglucosamine-6-phosphate deacetylase
MIQTPIYKKDSSAVCLHCISNKAFILFLDKGIVTNMLETETLDSNIPLMGPGLIDLQINGVNGIDFNHPEVTQQEIIEATRFLLSQGVTTFLPTVITNSDENICKIVSTIHSACSANTLVNDCIWGIHLEGPFLSNQPGAKGAHDEKYVKDPDWELFTKFQHAAGGKIKMITIAPERVGTVAFIEKCREQKILVSLGHSMANAEQINLAITAGASMATHLGNAVPLMLPRHPNMLWELLAAEDLYACIIADGIHIPDAFIKVVMKNKADKTLVVSDATCFAGMAPGEYRNHIGGAVIVDEEKRVSLKSTPGLLAGAAKTLLENVETLVDHKLATLDAAWKMASVNIANMLVKNDDTFYDKEDFVLFRLIGKKIQVETVIKKGRIVFEQ